MWDPRLGEKGVEQEQVGPPDKIALVIEYSCTFWVWYTLLTSLTPELAKQALPGPGGMSDVRIPATAGQRLGYISGRTPDFSVVDSELMLSGLIAIEHYAFEPRKIYVAYRFGVKGLWGGRFHK